MEGLMLEPLRLPDINEWLVVAGLVLIVADVVFGLAKAVKTRTLSSGKMRDGLWHKAAYLAIWCVAYVFNAALGYAALGFDVPTFDAVSVYVIAMEGLSVVENAAMLNPDLAGSRLLALFDDLRGKGAAIDPDATTELPALDRDADPLG